MYFLKSNFIVGIKGCTNTLALFNYDLKYYKYKWSEESLLLVAFHKLLYYVWLINLKLNFVNSLLMDYYEEHNFEHNDSRNKRDGGKDHNKRINKKEHLFREYAK